MMSSFYYTAASNLYAKTLVAVLVRGIMGTTNHENGLVRASPFFVVVAGHATMWPSSPFYSFAPQRIYTVATHYSSKTGKRSAYGS
jgi:hypothetical protein